MTGGIAGGDEDRTGMPNAFLNKLGRWAEFSHADRLLLAQLPGEALTLQRGEQPLPDADKSGRSILMLDGWAGLCKESASGQRVISELLMPGDLHRHSRHRDSSLSLTMLAPGSVLLLSPANIAMLDEHPTIGPALEWATTVQQSIHREWLVNIGKNKVYARAAHLLCEIAARMNSGGLLDDECCAMPLTQADLADALSMTVAHLNIALQRLRSENVVRLDQKRLTITDRGRLESIAQYDDRYLMRWPTELPDRRGRARGRRAVDRRSRAQVEEA
ncbi:MAG TPA: Crp/Fnr family transcriptional regulator [Sphingomonas sp.]|nr:Crp/Fnr family transcriptional regulator [Sphingomonas sp.]